MKFRTVLLVLLSLCLASQVSVAQESPPAKTAQKKQGNLKRKKKTPALPSGVELLSDIEFSTPNGMPLKLDLYLPEKRTDAIPVVVFVHGGGWKNGSKAVALNRTAWLAQHGFAVAGISYRLTDSGQWPDQIDDCYAAVRWLRAHAADHGIDPEHIGCWGTSAGGHLVALMGTRPYPGEEQVSSRVQAVCDWFGPTDLLTMPPNMLGNGRTEEDIANSNGAKLLGDTVRDIPDVAKDASGLHHVSKDDPPFLIIHGTADPGVPLSQSERLHTALSDAGVDSTLVKLPGAGHGGPQFNAPEVREAIVQFFTRTLKRSN